MRDLSRLSHLARQAGAYERDRLEPVQPPARDSIISSSNDQHIARERLVVQRTGSTLYKDPNKQKRHVFRSKTKKAELSDHSHWTFTTAERFAELDRHIRQGGEVSLAQAILSIDLETPVDVNQSYAVNNRNESIATGHPNGWLEYVAARDDVNYVRLLTAFGASQDTKDRALAAALQQRALAATQELLRNKADPNAVNTDYFINAIAGQDLRLINMFLSSVIPLNENTINEALAVAVGRNNTEIVALLFAHGANGDYANGQALCASIDGGHVEDAATILLHSQHTISQSSIESAIGYASSNSNPSLKFLFLEMLLNSGANPSAAGLQNQLLSAVQANDRRLLELLIHHGVSPDRNDAESLRLAITSNKIELVPVLLSGDISASSASIALADTELMEDNDQFKEVVIALIEKGVTDMALHKCLADAATRGRAKPIAPALISHGADLDYDNARCVREALQQNNIGLFETLLKAPSQASILVKALPEAMNVQPRSECLHVVQSLLQKGINGIELHIALRSIVSVANHDSDYQLIDAFIRNKASVNFSDENGNCLCIAAAREDEKALELLAEGNPTDDTASMALGRLPIYLRAAGAVDYERTARMTLLLLEKDAYGNPVSEMLITAVEDDHRGKILDYLLSHGADANYNSGSAVAKALQLPDVGVLRQICTRSRLLEDTIAAQLPLALRPATFSFEKASILAHAAAKNGFNRVLNNPLLQEVKHHGSRANIVQLLINLKADPNYERGEALRHAVGQGDIKTTDIILSAKPLTTTVARAFPIAMEIQDLSVRFALIKALLARGGPDMGHEALIQSAREASAQDLSHVQLLLQYGASPNYKNGAPVLQSIERDNIPLLDLFVRTKLTENTLIKAFECARQVNTTATIRRQIFTSLFGSNYRAFNTNEALVEAVRHEAIDIETCKILITNGASVDFETGMAMQTVSERGCVELLDLFISKQPAQASKDKAFLSATLSHLLNVETRRSIYELLLNAGISQDYISKALVEAARQDHFDEELLTLLISHGASLDFDAGAAVCFAGKKGDPELLKILFQGSVSRSETLSRAFEASMGTTSEARYSLAQQLLGKEPGVNVNVVSQYLSVIAQDQDHALLELVMRYNPDPSFNESESLVMAAASCDHICTELLIRGKVPKEASDKAFEAILDSGGIQSKPHGLETAALLLPLGIKQALLDRALLDSFDSPIDHKTEDLVELLIPYKPNFNTADGRVFVEAARARNTRLFETMAMQKPELNTIIPSLVLAFQGGNDLEDQVRDLTTGETTLADSQKLDEMVHEKSNANPLQPPVEDDIELEPEAPRDDYPTEAVETLEWIRHGEVEEIGENMQEKRSRNEPTSEERLVMYLEILEHYTDRDGRLLNDSVIFTALTAFPEGSLLAKHLLDNGCPPDSKIIAASDPCHVLFRYENIEEEEELTAVIWALGRDEPTISDDVIQLFLENIRDPAISFRTSITQLSAITIASAKGRHAVVERLITIGADVTSLDGFDHSASFYASRNGFKDVVESLHAAGAKGNDSSLQEAAREAHPDIVRFLLASGHRADFPSGLHADEYAGRTALEELCLHSSPSRKAEAWNDQVHECIRQLLPEKPTDTKRPGGKTMVHLALENIDPVPITRVLLEFAWIWENINHPVYLFKDAQGYFYSPTKYVETFCDISQQKKEEILILLRAKKCLSRYYAHTVEQPEGAVGLPDEIAAAVERKKRDEFEHLEAIKRQNDLAARNRAIEAEDYQRRVAEDKEQHQVLQRQQRERENSEKEVALRKQERERKQAQEMHQATQDAITLENQLRSQGLVEEASRRQVMQEREQVAEMNYKRTLANQEYSALEMRVGLEERLLAARERAANEAANRELNLLSRREATAKYEADQRQRAAHANSNGY